jgi:excisionase family DNA binding protein
LTLLPAAARTLARYSSAPTIRLAVGDGEASPISLPADIFAQIVDLLSKIANGNAVSIVPIDAELTTQQAADLMNVSRPHVIKLIERGDLPHRMVGTHRKPWPKATQRGPNEPPTRKPLWLHVWDLSAASDGAAYRTRTCGPIITKENRRPPSTEVFQSFLCFQPEISAKIQGGPKCALERPSIFVL